MFVSGTAAASGTWFSTFGFGARLTRGLSRAAGVAGARCDHGRGDDCRGNDLLVSLH